MHIHICVCVSIFIQAYLLTCMHTHKNCPFKQQTKGRDKKPVTKDSGGKNTSGIMRSIDFHSLLQAPVEDGQMNKMFVKFKIKA